MPLHLSPRQWFWYSVIAAAFFAFMGGGPEASAQGHTQPSFFRRLEWYVHTPVDLLLTPGRAVFNGAQSLVSSAFSRLTSRPADAPTAQALNAQIRYQEDLIAYQNGQLNELYRLLQDLKSVSRHGLSATDILPANITAYEAGPGASLLKLDKGSADGVALDMVVIAKVSPLGRIVSVSPKTSTVRLLTDPTSSTATRSPAAALAGVRARIVRKSDPGDQVIVPACLVKGLGNGEMICDSVDTDTPVPPQPGDRVQLLDPNWPARVQYMILGDVTAVARSDKQLLRYQLKIAPRVSPAAIDSVLIVLHGD
jgi:hypothetical protein